MKIKVICTVIFASNFNKFKSIFKHTDNLQVAANQMYEVT